MQLVQGREHSAGMRSLQYSKYQYGLIPWCDLKVNHDRVTSLVLLGDTVRLLVGDVGTNTLGDL